MQKVKVKNVAYMGFVINEQGFTLISSLLRITIISLTLPILVYVFSNLDTNSLEETLSIEQLYFIMQNEIYKASEVSHTHNQLSLKVDNNIVSFSRYGAVIRRQVNKQGHEIYQRDITDFSIKSVSNGLMVTITTHAGDVYERILTTNE